MMHRKVAILGVLGALALGFTALVSVSQAQYPPPVGGVSVQSSSTTTSPGDTPTITCTVVGENGSPVANAPCNFTIASQPGGDASIDSDTKVTDAQGKATASLNVGTTPGVVIVQVTSGEFVSQVLVSVEGGLPPQSPITPPSTGSGGLLP